eukprot:SAG22_NODE_1216_length_5142_cov_2.131866_2_plen_176_part_00
MAAYPTSQYIGFRTPYDVAPRHFAVIFTYTSKEDVTAGYVCTEGLQPMVATGLHPPYISGVPYVDDCGSTFDAADESQTPTKDDSLGVKGILPVFNTAHTMRWCLDSSACARSTNTYCGASKADGLCQNSRMAVYTPDYPFLVEFDGYVRARVIADNYQVRPSVRVCVCAWATGD